jgi:signal transduction histidine kinase
VGEGTGLGLVSKVVAAVVALVGVLAGVAVVLSAQHTAGLEADNRTRAAAANAVPVVAAALRSAMTTVETGGGSGAREVELDQVRAEGIPADLVVQARDTGKALLADTGLVVAPHYGAPAPPESVAARRDAFVGLYVAPVRIASTLSRLRPPDGGVTITGPSRMVGSIGGTRPGDASSYTVTLSTALAPGWDVTVWTPGGQAGPGAWLVAALCVLAGLLGGLWVVRRGRVVADTAAELDQLRHQSSVLAGLAGVAQRSLDLADVLPAVTTQLSDALGLRGISLTTPTRDGEERAFFRNGELPTPAPGSALPESVPPGRSLSLLLARGGRTIARLNVLAGRPLDAEDMATLEAAGEILTSALTNAEAFAQQREALQRLRSVDELKTVFLATASHELRTPVGVISGFAELLSAHVETLSAQKVREYAARIDATAQQLGSLVENLLDFSRMERGIVGQGEQDDLDLGDTVRRILDEHRDLSAQHEVLVATAPGLVVRGTEHAVERVLTNLVGNAAKYSPAGTTIRVHVREEGGKAVLHVDDEGAGVAPADRDQVFSRFYRGSGDAVTNTRGAGLGLAIVHEFAASMGGVASVTEAPSGGARFTVRFPLADRTDPSLPATRAPAEGTTDVLT